MKRIITASSPTEIRIEDLTAREIIAYRTANEGNGVCILTKLNKANTYGFVYLNSSTSGPSFVEEGWFPAVQKAATQRKLFAFDSMMDLAKAIVDKNI